MSPNNSEPDSDKFPEDENVEGIQEIEIPDVSQGNRHVIDVLLTSKDLSYEDRDAPGKTDNEQIAPVSTLYGRVVDACLHAIKDVPQTSTALPVQSQRVDAPTSPTGSNAAQPSQSSGSAHKRLRYNFKEQKNFKIPQNSKPRVNKQKTRVWKNGSEFVYYRLLHPNLRFPVQALREIRHYQKTTDSLLPYAPFARLVREVSQQVSTTPIRFQVGAIGALRQAAEDMLASNFAG